MAGLSAVSTRSSVPPPSTVATAMAGPSGAPLGFQGALDAAGAGTTAAAGGGKPSIVLNRRSEAETRAAIHKSAGDFEATCLGQLLGFMTQEIEVDPNFGGGHGEEMYREMMNAEYGKLAQRSGRVGLASKVEGDLLRAQGLEPLKGTAARGVSVRA